MVKGAEMTCVAGLDSALPEKKLSTSRYVPGCQAMGLAGSNPSLACRVCVSAAPAAMGTKRVTVSMWQGAIACQPLLVCSSIVSTVQSERWSAEKISDCKPLAATTVIESPTP